MAGILRFWGAWFCKAVAIWLVMVAIFQGMNCHLKYSKYVKLVIGVFALSTVLTACNETGRGGKGSQVVAVVNSDEITVHQLNGEIARLELPENADIQTIESDVKSLLVDQQLLLQRARELGMQRKPEVLSAVERVRNQLLAKLYLERVMATARDPDEAELKAYYDENPQLFAERKLYDYLQVMVSEPEDKTGDYDIAAITEQLVQAKDVGRFVTWLDHAGVPYQAAHVIEGPEDMPAPIFDVLRDMAPGETSQLESPDRIMIIRLYQSVDGSISLPDAEPEIRKSLLEQKRKNLATTELDTLRAAATIKYFDGKGDKQPDERP